MKKVNSLLLLFVVFSLIMASGASAQLKLAKIADPDPVSEVSVTAFTKPGGIDVGDAMPRAFHYGGRHSARTSDGLLHVSWEDPGYDFPYYAHSLDELGLEWTEPMNIPETIGYTGWSRSLMAKLSIDPTNDDLYLLPAIQITGGVWRTQLTRSTDGGETWTPFMDLGNKINVPTAEVSWATMTIGSDRVVHITYAKQNQDMFYTKADLSAADGAADLENLVFTKSDGSVGAEAISFVPSGVVFQGTILLDRNNDPHIIFSGDGGSDTFGDKTPYHIYYKSAAQAWGPIPPTRLRAELEDCWGMPEMIFDQNNRGYYFMDGYEAETVWFGTWEPPTDATSATDFGSLNNGEGYEGAVQFNSDNYANIPVVNDDHLYLPNADVDDENDIVYVVMNTNWYENFVGGGGDIVALKLVDATSYAGVGPADMDWELHRWITQDGNSPLGDQGCDVVYDPARSTLDIFWSAAGAPFNKAQYIDGTAVIPEIDAKPQTLDFGLTVNNPINKGETIVMTGTVKNNGTSSLGPVPVSLVITNESGDTLYTKNDQTPPLLAGAESRQLTLGEFTVPTEKEFYNIYLTSLYNGDGAAYNDVVSSGFYAYPSLDEVVVFETFQEYLNLDEDGDHNWFPFPTWSEKATYSDDLDLGGWTTVDSANTEDFDWLNTWFVNDEDEPNNIGAYIRHMAGIRNDTLYGDMATGTIPQPQNELLYSPVYDLETTNDVYLEFSSKIGGTDGDDNFPIYALVDLSVDGGTTWLPVVHWAKTVGGAAEAISFSLEYMSYEITDMVAGASSVQFRFWWKNLNNDGGFATWFVDNVTVIDRDPLGNAVDNVAVIDGYKLSQNYPNPFNPTTDIQFTMPASGKAKLTIYNVTGQQVAKLIDGTVAQGTHTVRFDAQNLPTGVYFYKFQTENFESVKKMALMK